MDLCFEKEDIEILTKQFIEQRREILDTIKREHIKIDTSLLNEEFLPKIEQKIQQITETEEKNSIHENGILLEDMEDTIRRFDSLEKKIFEQKTAIQNNAVGGTVARKEQQGIKRFGSITDINKTLPRSLSTMNLNATNNFAEPNAPASRTNKNPNATLMPDVGNKESAPAMTNKLTQQQLNEHNSLKEDIENRLESLEIGCCNYSIMLKELSKKHTESFDRLKQFFKEVQQVRSNKPAEMEDEALLKGLDDRLIKSMKKLSEALIQARFIAENTNLYDLGGFKVIEPILSDDLTDILEYFYRNNK